ncbi:hypothetical protein Tco_1031027 [Tanacetum coccineum]|uniref:Uncharacterized protein n=1 Tax=Tanacetum coccineum TaxID=301880 RepID=A0ABQ5G967_9ASTR
MALPEDHLAKFHKMTDAKEMWKAIKSRFGGNDESKKMQKYILKQQFEGFSVSNSEGLHKGYDRFQSLLSQLEIHGAGISTDDVNQKFLRSLPSAWSQVSLIMRTKPGVDNLSFDDLYNNLRVFESDVKGSTTSSSSTQNVAFVSENTSSTNDVSTAYGVSNSSGHNSQYEHTSSYSLLSNQSSYPQLDHEDLEQLDEFDLEEMGLKWQVAMFSMRMKKFYKKTALVTLDGEGIDWTSHSEDEQENYALMACSSLGSDTEREQLGDASIEIQAYTQALKKIYHNQQTQLWYEEKIRFMKIDLDDKTDVLTYHKKLLAEAEKEKEDLKAKVEKWHNSSKNLNILLNSQMSARDKAGLGYGDQMNKGVLSYENEVFQSVFVSRTSEIEDSLVNDRYVEGMHTVPPPMTRIYIPSGPDKEIDDSQFIYDPNEETHESMPEPVVNEPKVVSQPKVWSGAPIIEEYESDSEDEHVSLPTKEHETPSFAFINTIKHIKTPRQTVKEQNTCSQSPKPDKKDCSGLMSKKLGLGYGYTKKACFVCGSFCHLIRDYDFHEKRMAKQAELNNRMSKGSGQREIRPVWNNVQRVNHQNQFVPKAVLTRTGKIQVNTARTSGTNTVNTAKHNFYRQAVPTNVARKVNTVKPIVKNAGPKTGFHKTLSSFRKPFNRTTTLRTNFSKQKVNTAEVNAVSAVGGKRETAVKPSAGCNWRPKRHYWNKVSKYNGGSRLSTKSSTKQKVKKLAEEEATKAALSNEYDFIQARLNADKILAEKLQEEEREMYTIEQRAKLLHDTIAAQRRFLAQQRSEAIINKPLSRNQLRNQMMTYLKHVRGKKHSDLKTKSFKEIKALYEKIKRSDDSFIAIGSAEDEKVIKEMNEQVADASKKRVEKDDSIKGEIKEEEGTRKRKLGIRKKMKSKKRKFTFKDDEELRLCLTIVYDEDKEVNYEILDKKYPIIEWRSEYLTTKPQYDETEEVEDVYLNVVIRKTEEDSTMALELIRFVKKQIAELEPEDSDGDEKDL